jgi:hypothetical protein
MSTRRTLTAAVFLALLWALVVFFENLVAVSLDESPTRSCSLDHPKVALSVATAGVCLAAATAFGLGLTGRSRGGLPEQDLAVAGLLAQQWQHVCRELVQEACLVLAGSVQDQLVEPERDVAADSLGDLLGVV